MESGFLCGRSPDVFRVTVNRVGRIVSARPAGGRTYVPTHQTGTSFTDMRRPGAHLTVDELREHVLALPRDLAVWRAGPDALYQLLYGSSALRYRDILLAMRDGGDTVERCKHWQHVTATLVDWHHRWADSTPGHPVQEGDFLAAIDLARDWQVLETIHTGLANGDITIAEVDGWDVRLTNHRNAAVEVLDVILEQVTIPAVPPDPDVSLEPVNRWFHEHRGRADLIFDIPGWAVEATEQEVVGLLRARGLSMPPETDLGGLTLAQARDCYAFLIAHTGLAGSCTVKLGSLATMVWYADPGKLKAGLAKWVGDSAAAAFLDLCTYVPGRSPISAPLIPDGGRLAIPEALVSPVAFERTLLRAAAADPSRAGRLGNELGRRAARWAQRLREVPGAQVAERLKVTDRDGATVGDLDVAAYDAEHDVVMVVEVKWPVDAGTLSESGKVDLAFDTGRRQVERLRRELAEGGSVRWPRGWGIGPTTTLHWWVATAQQLDSGRTTHPTIRTTSLRLVEQLLPATSLADLHDRLVGFPLPRAGIEYVFTDRVVRTGRYTITCPTLEILGDRPVPPPDRRTDLGWT